LSRWDHYEMISNGVFLMDTRSGESKRLLVPMALRRGGDRSRLLMGGLGVGFSLSEALRSNRLEHMTGAKDCRMEPPTSRPTRWALALQSGVSDCGDQRRLVVVRRVA
jgi:hypothetical protein